MTKVVRWPWERSKTILAPRVCVDSDQPGPPPTVPTPEADGTSKEPITDNRSHRRRDTKTAAAENSAGSQSTADVQGGAGFSIASMITGILGALVSAVSSPAAIASLFIATFLLFLCPCIGIFGSALPVVAYCGVLLGMVLAAVAVICGHVGKHRRGYGMACTGLILGWPSLIIDALTIIVPVAILLIAMLFAVPTPQRPGGPGGGDGPAPPPPPGGQGGGGTKYDLNLAPGAKDERPFHFRANQRVIITVTTTRVQGPGQPDVDLFVLRRGQFIASDIRIHPDCKVDFVAAADDQYTVRVQNQGPGFARSRIEVR